MKNLTGPLVLITIVCAFTVGIISATYYSNKAKQDFNRDNNMLVFSFQGCEYLKYRDCIIHKGNCTNDIHMAEFVELIKLRNGWKDNVSK